MKPSEHPNQNLYCDYSWTFELKHTPSHREVINHDKKKEHKLLKNHLINQSNRPARFFFSNSDTKLFAFEKCISTPIFSEEFFYFGCHRNQKCSCCSKKKITWRKEVETDFFLEIRNKMNVNTNKKSKRKESREPIAARTTWLFSKNKRKKTIIKLVFSNVPLFCYLLSDLLMPNEPRRLGQIWENSSDAHSMRRGKKIYFLL